MKRFYSPASIGNYCVGFDSLGAALAPIDGSMLGDIVSIEPAQYDEFECIGHYAEKLPKAAEDNLAYQCLEHFRAHVAPDMPKLKMTLEKNLPIGSGLGSSACSVVAAFAALNDFAQTALSDKALLELMADFESKVSGARHYDNIAPCFIGGLSVCSELFPERTLPLAAPTHWYHVIAYPGFALNTSESRAVLPKHVENHNAVEFAQRLTGFSLAMNSKDYDTALLMMNDGIAEPYRAPLIEGFQNAKQALPELGVKCVSISGAGPTLFAICETLETAEACQLWLNKHYINEFGFSHICKIDELGTRAI